MAIDACSRPLATVACPIVDGANADTNKGHNMPCPDGCRAEWCDAPIDTLSAPAHCSDSHGFTVLHWAAKCGRSGIVRMMITRQADVDRRT